jgi:hypothetical protein
VNFEDARKIISGLSLDVRILARELYGRDGADLALVDRTIGRMLDDLGRLREQLAGEDGAP